MHKTTIILLFLIGCTQPSDPLTWQTPIVQNNTLFIGGAIEATPDSSIYYPQVFVAEVIDQRKSYIAWEDESIFPIMDKLQKAIPITLIMHNLSVLNLKPKGITDAEVKLTGTVNGITQTINLISEGLGIYSDKERRLTIKPEGTYKLQVKAKGRTYESTTTLPKLIETNLKETLPITLKLDSVLVNGKYEYREIPLDHPKVGFKTGVTNSNMAIFQMNVENDKDFLNSRNFQYGIHGNWIREGFRYYAYDGNLAPEAVPLEFGSIPQHQARTQASLFFKATRFDTNLTNWYNQEYIVTAVNTLLTPEDKKRDQALVDVTYKRNPAYLWEISSWVKLDDNGNPLPKSQNDALGYFGGVSARYIKSTLQINRNFDPCRYNWKGCPSNP
jgi:hypothetical protein